ncbi:hypothetical protein [Streptomyces sp. NPDC093071]|uniref:hypothetical protein n=1 Tax=Streptomyces sp. NPDC093071 TaxID=3366022 RepID=UPI00380C23F2
MAVTTAAGTPPLARRVLRGTVSFRGGQPVAQPTRPRFGRDRDPHVFTCPSDLGHPPAGVLP